jgi:hypothetical protein
LTAVGEGAYEVVFDGSVEPSTVLCTVDTSGVAPGVSVKPDPFMSGGYGDPRPIMAAVLAMHRASQSRTLAATGQEHLCGRTIKKVAQGRDGSVIEHG